MTDEKKNAGNPFTGLPSEILIEEVLRAATEASEQVKRSGTEYPDLADPGKGDPEKSKTAVFSFRKTGIVRDGEETEELVEIQAPLLSLVPVPSMTLDEVNVNFDMDVVPSVTGQKTDEREPAAGLCRKELLLPRHNTGMIRERRRDTMSMHCRKMGKCPKACPVCWIFSVTLQVQMNPSGIRL